MDRISPALDAVQRGMPAIRCCFEEPMKNHTSFKIGGFIRAMFFPENAEDMAELFRLLHDYEVEPLVIGNGTNLLVDDARMDMVAIKTAGLCEITRSGETEINADAGVSLKRLAEFAEECGLSGLEFAHGIPGSLGGALSMNAGAYGGEIKDVVHSTDALSHKTGSLRVSGDEHCFSYRHSIFSDSGLLALSSRLRVENGDKDSIRARMNEFDSRRRESQPLELPSAGSTFKRPVEGYAAALIEQAGLKGFSIGGAQVSGKHAGFIVNMGGATFADVNALIDYVRETVFIRLGVMLETEVKIIRGT